MDSFDMISVYQLAKQQLDAFETRLRQAHDFSGRITTSIINHRQRKRWARIPDDTQRNRLVVLLEAAAVWEDSENEAEQWLIKARDNFRRAQDLVEQEVHQALYGAPLLVHEGDTDHVGEQDVAGDEETVNDGDHMDNEAYNDQEDEPPFVITEDVDAGEAKRICKAIYRQLSLAAEVLRNQAFFEGTSTLQELVRRNGGTLHLDDVLLSNIEPQP